MYGDMIVNKYQGRDLYEIKSSRDLIKEQIEKTITTIANEGIDNVFNRLEAKESLYKENDENHSSFVLKYYKNQQKAKLINLCNELAYLNELIDSAKQ